MDATTKATRIAELLPIATAAQAEVEALTAASDAAMLVLLRTRKGTLVGDLHAAEVACKAAAVALREATARFNKTAFELDRLQG